VGSGNEREGGVREGSFCSVHSTGLNFGVDGGSWGYL